MDKTRTITFDKIKANVMVLARARLDKSKELWGPVIYRKDVDGLGRFYGLDIAIATLLPSVIETLDTEEQHQDVHIRMMDELSARCACIINDWDVRQVNRLIDLFPESVPASCRLRNAICDYDGKGDWVVTFDLSRRRTQGEDWAGLWGSVEAAFNYVAGNVGRLNSVLADVSMAHEDYKTAWATFEAEPVGSNAVDAIRAATADFNKVLERAAHAFYLDTQDYNNWDTIRQVYGPGQGGWDDMSLWFVGSHEVNLVCEKLRRIAADLQAGVYEKAIKEQAAELEDSDRESQSSPTPRG